MSKQGCTRGLRRVKTKRKCATRFVMDHWTMTWLHVDYTDTVCAKMLTTYTIYMDSGHNVRVVIVYADSMSA